MILGSYIIVYSNCFNVFVLNPLVVHGSSQDKEKLSVKGKFFQSVQVYIPQNNPAPQNIPRH